MQKEKRFSRDEAQLETSKIANRLNTLQREHIVNRANSSFQKGDNAILQKGVKKSRSFQSANSHVYVIHNKWTKMLNLKQSHLSGCKISKLVHLGPASSIIIHMAYEKSEPAPDIKIESYILAL